MASIFSRIVNGEIPCYKVAEDEHFFAFLDINPLAEGHTLVIPKEETDYLFDLEDQHYQDLWLFAKKVGRAVESVVPCQRIGLAVLGLEVPHAHIHVVPINTVYDIDFKKPKLHISQERFEELAKGISRAYESENQ
jgi:histidine triad (HIT) family protein